MWESRRLTTLWTFTVCYRGSFYLYLLRKLELYNRDRGNTNCNSISQVGTQLYQKSETKSSHSSPSEFTAFILNKSTMSCSCTLLILQSLSSLSPSPSQFGAQLLSFNQPINQLIYQPINLPSTNRAGNSNLTEERT
jgi:hypothetical protein